MPLKVEEGFEPSLKDLQSFTLPLCYPTLIYFKIIILELNIVLFLMK